MLEQDVVLAADASARRAGVHPGMRRGGALALAPAIEMHERDPARERAALHDIAVALMRFAPAVAICAEDTLLVEIGPSLRLFGGVRALCRQARAVLAALGFHAVFGLAPTGQGAWLLARAGDRRVLRLTALARALDTLPLSSVPETRPFLAWFDGLGCMTVADLRRLPRAGLKRRCGAHLLDSLDRALGAAPELFDWLTVPPVFAARLELPERIDHAQLALHAAQRLVVQLCGWLSALQLRVTALTLLLEHERGRQAVPPTAVELAFGEPAWQEAHLMRLLRERLARIAGTEAGGPIIALRLEARQVQAAAPQSDDLFPEPGGTPADHARLLEILTARLGADNVLCPAPRADYRPETANHWVPSGQAARAPAAAALLPRPAWLLREPLRLLMREHRPFYGSPLRFVSAAERVEAGWFDGALVTRDYYVAQGDTHACYWIYRERVGSRDAEPRWFLHGLFG